MLRIGMLTSGGDCQALNAAMGGVVKRSDLWQLSYAHIKGFFRNPDKRRHDPRYIETAV